ncbi:sugar phosphorylase [Neorhodopirellula pilleata]|uniref:Sucrose phosphorylase n=1 Tax=Neorhodopirellula pilleata TaxID=2714738 RepID=A0A5C6ABD1_9BACT|nr:sugar phosphorylase [Neorhodopirellula pilleata]TWT97314.1 Sucrose phosphorylase [Neorhodopirellula pilleata]
MTSATDETTDFQETHDRIREVYGEVPDVLAEGLKSLINTCRTASVETSGASSEANSGASSGNPLWDHRDVVLITYADQVRALGLSPLQTQHRFLTDNGLEQLIRCVHLLPFCPSTSDDGFSVADYLAVDPEFGTWDDIHALGRDFDLMYDLVLNHSSQAHEWFQGFIADNPQYAEFYATADPSEDLSSVVRPRSLPLLTPFETPSGTRYVWTTFSADQVDLNYANPQVMLRMITTLVEYALRGARIIRLDAIAFLWKQIGTSCLHLPQTHAAVKLMRHVLDRTVPGTIVLTETNVPHQENISYFGDGNDEAHMVYQFSLPPLMLDAIHSGDTGVLADWMRSLSLPSDQTTYFNFTASHDGIGVRPAEGLVPPERIDRLVQIVRDHGSRIGMRANSDGTESPYELNITYLDAVADRRTVSAAEHSRRFLATQAIMLSMRGVPAVYFHSLVGSPSDIDAVKTSGIPRRINRHKYDAEELNAALSNPDSLQRRVFEGYRRLLEVRRRHVAFDPKADQEVLDLPTDGLIGFVRTAADGQRVGVIANLTDQPRTIRIDPVKVSYQCDVLAQEDLSNAMPLSLRPFQVRWLK